MRDITRQRQYENDMLERRINAQHSQYIDYVNKAIYANNNNNPKDVIFYSNIALQYNFTDASSIVTSLHRLSISTLVIFFSMLLPSFLMQEAQSGRVAYGCHGKSRTGIPYRISKYRCLTFPQELHSVWLFLYLISLICSIPLHRTSALVAISRPDF